MILYILNLRYTSKVYFHVLVHLYLVVSCFLCYASSFVCLFAFLLLFSSFFFKISRVVIITLIWFDFLLLHFISGRVLSLLAPKKKISSSLVFPRLMQSPSCSLLSSHHQTRSATSAAESIGSRRWPNAMLPSP